MGQAFLDSNDSETFEYKECTAVCTVVDILGEEYAANYTTQLQPEQVFLTAKVIVLKKKKKISLFFSIRDRNLILNTKILS